MRAGNKFQAVAIQRLKKIPLSQTHSCLFNNKVTTCSVDQSTTIRPTWY